MKLSKRIKWALPLALVMALLVTTIAFAITITVDGVKEAAWSGSGGQTPGSGTDPNEGAITDGYDMAEVMWTNDTTNMYLLVETYADVIFTGTPRPTLIICIDTDNNTSTGGSYANCNNMSGIDRSIIMDRSSAEIYNGDPNSGTYIADGTAAYQTVITEVSVSLANLGISTPAQCIQNMPAVVYFDNGTGDPDDNTPDSGTMTIGCGTPTAITLSEISATSNTPWMIMAAAALLLVISGGAVLAYKRHQV